MMLQSKRIVLIPAYCPDEKLISLVQTLHEMNYEIIVVNDESSEETMLCSENPLGGS